MAPQTSAFGLGEIGQIAITVRDLKQAKEFYRDKLGMKLLFEIPSMAFFACGNLRLALGTAESPDTPPFIVYYRVDDIQHAYDTLLARGVRGETKPHLLARMPDHELWMAALRDGENNVFQLMSEVRK